MAIDLKKLVGLGAVVLALTAAPVMSQGLGDWDADGDGALNQGEFDEGWGSAYGDDESAFSTWDEDRDGVLSEDEYNTGIFNSYDRDGSGVIEEPEFGDIGDDMGDGGL